VDVIVGLHEANGDAPAILRKRQLSWVGTGDVTERRRTTAALDLHDRIR
jgi:hypothetical protein